VRSTVEETLKVLLDAEADRLCNAEKYQRNSARQDTRVGHYQPKPQTSAGKVTLLPGSVTWLAPSGVRNGI